MRSNALVTCLLLGACNVSMDPLPNAGAGGGSAGFGDAGSGGGAAGGGAAGSGGSAGGPTGADGGMGAPLTSLVAGKGIDLRSRMPVAMAVVTVDQHPEIPAATTGADGVFMLAGVPGLQPVTLRVEKAAYVPDQIPLVADATRIDLAPLRLVPADANDTLAGASGAPADATRGHVLTLAVGDVMGTGLTGVTVRISPAAGTGPAYLDPSDQRDAALSTTGTSGTALFTNVTPGEVEVVFSHPSRTCRPLHATPGTTPGSVKVAVAAGRVTAGVEVLCPP